MQRLDYKSKRDLLPINAGTILAIGPYSCVTEHAKHEN